jgi:hypothetical protein
VFTRPFVKNLPLKGGAGGAFKGMFLRFEVAIAKIRIDKIPNSGEKSETEPTPSLSRMVKSSNETNASFE